MNAPNDGALLQAFRTRNDEQAFAELVRRHGRLVLAAARAVVEADSAAEDVAQAAFLTLVRKGRAFEQDASVAGWLCHVATCLARNERRHDIRRQAREQEAAMNTLEPQAPPAIPRGALAVLYEELGQLSEKYRQPVILHHLEGLSYAAAAALCGCTDKAFSVRLVRAREQLRKRLVARGVTLGADGIDGVLEESATSAVMPAALVVATCQAASLLAAGKTLSGSGLVSAKVAYLTKGALKTLFWAKVKTAALATAASLAVVAGGGLAVHQALAHQAHRPPPPAPATGGQVYAWGDNRSGQLGDGTTTDRLTPVPVKLAAGSPLSGITAVAGGNGCTLALAANGRVYVWGGGSRPGTATVPMPVRMPDGSQLSGIAAIAASLGGAAPVALKKDGRVWELAGQAGDGTATDSLTPVPVTLADGSQLSGITAIAVGESHAVARQDDGGLWAWGANVAGQLGDGTTNSSPTPVPVTLADGTPLSGITAIAAGQGHTVALRADGSVWAWGKNTNGQLGDGTKAHRRTPVPVKMMDGTPLSGITAIAAGAYHTLAIKADGRVWAWGLNVAGQLGAGAVENRLTPVPVTVADGSPLSGVTAIAAGWWHTVARQADGSVWVWGGNSCGQLGDGTTTNRSAPAPVKLADGSPLSGISAIAGGYGHTVIVVGTAAEDVNSRR